MFMRVWAWKNFNFLEWKSFVPEKMWPWITYPPRPTDCWCTLRRRCGDAAEPTNRAFLDFWMEIFPFLAVVMCAPLVEPQGRGSHARWRTIRCWCYCWRWWDADDGKLQRKLVENVSELVPPRHVPHMLFWRGSSHSVGKVGKSFDSNKSFPRITARRSFVGGEMLPLNAFTCAAGTALWHVLVECTGDD